MAHAGLGSVQRDLRIQGPQHPAAGTGRMPKTHAEPTILQQIPLKVKSDQGVDSSVPKRIHELFPSFRCHAEQSEWEEVCQRSLSEGPYHLGLLHIYPQHQAQTWGVVLSNSLLND